VVDEGFLWRGVLVGSWGGLEGLGRVGVGMEGDVPASSNARTTAWEASRVASRMCIYIVVCCEVIGCFAEGRFVAMRDACIRRCEVILGVDAGVG
jgi:hypothetical protein